MEELQEQPKQLPSAPFPAPPPFWKCFTKTNLERLEEKQAEDKDSTSLPFELACLRPPPPPSDDQESYTTFASVNQLHPGKYMPPEDILLFDPKDPNLNHAALLRRLTKSLLLNFLELSTILGNDPEEYAEKMEDLNTLMINVHSVINMYRPHQAREGVREMLQARLDDGRAEMAKCDEIKDRVEGFLKEVEQNRALRNSPDNDKLTHMNGVSHESDEVKESRNMWAMINDLPDEDND